MSDMGPLFNKMQESALDMSAASSEMKIMMTADDKTDVPIKGHGVHPSFAKQINNKAKQVNAALDSAVYGYILVDSFQAGVALPNNEITVRSQAVRDERDGKYYIWRGALPKKVPAGSTPQSLGGINDAGWMVKTFVEDRVLVGGVNADEVRLAGDSQPNWQIQGDKGLYPKTARGEMAQMLNSGEWDGEAALLMNECLDEIKFQFYDGVGYLYQVIPYRRLNGVYYNIPLLGITSVGHSGPVGDNPFRCTGHYSVGVTAFRQVTGRAMHGLIRGSIELLLRVSDRSLAGQRLSGAISNRVPDIWMCLSALNGDGMNGRNRYAMAICKNWGQIPMFKLCAQGFNIPITYEECATRLASEPGIAHTVQRGWIRPNSISEELAPTTALDKTTSWMDIEGETLWYVSANGTSTVTRLQFKDAMGRVWYDHRQSGGFNDGRINSLYEIHPDAVQARIFFAWQQDTATDITVKAVPKWIDPAYGTWARYQINVNQHVDLLPDVDYSFTFAFFHGAGGQYDENGFIITSGGLSMLHDARDHRVRVSRKNTKGDV